MATENDSSTQLDLSTVLHAAALHFIGAIGILASGIASARGLDPDTATAAHLLVTEGRRLVETIEDEFEALRECEFINFAEGAQAILKLGELNEEDGLPLGGAWIVRQALYSVHGVLMDVQRKCPVVA